MEFLEIYRHEGARYQRMIAAEDFQGNLYAALSDFLPAHPASLLDLGSGTGRLPRLLGSMYEQITAVDLHRDMLVQQARTDHLHLIQSDMRRLPFADRRFDVVTAGWAIGHLVGWHPQDWKTQAGYVLNEMLRLAQPGGVLAIMETFSTGSETPAPPTPGLAELYGWFEKEWGFERRVIATDYLFASVEEAVELTGFFFGDDLVRKIQQNHWRQLPEWTGVWWRRA